MNGSVLFLMLWGQFGNNSLLAENSEWMDYLARGFSWAVAILTIASIVFIVQKWLETSTSRARKQAYRLFYELCRAHRLESSAIRTLTALVYDNHLEHPALIFLRPDLFQGEKLPESLQPRTAVVEQLRARLFEPRDSSLTASLHAPGGATPAR